MEPIVFCLHFRGQASRGTDKRNLFRITASAASCTFSSEVTDTGVRGHISVLPGEMAFADTELELTGSDAFTGRSSVCFGDGPHELRLESAAPGHLSSTTDAGAMSGGMTWKVVGGDGQFTGATGFVSSVLALREDGQFNEYQTGMLFVPKS